MPKRRHAVLAATVLVLTAACATPPAVTTKRFGTTVVPARAADAAVALYPDAPPACAFTRVGYVSVEGREARDRERLPELLRAAARDLGGDAVIDYAATDFRAGFGGAHPFAPLGNPPLESAWTGGTPGTARGEAPASGLILTGTVVRLGADC
jgi:hypothetical protein